MTPQSGTIGDQFWGPQPGHRCTGTEPGAPADPKPSECDDGPFGRGTGGELTYTLTLPANGSQTVWLAVAGSDQGLAAARTGARRRAPGPGRTSSPRRSIHVSSLAEHTQLSLPGDPLVEAARRVGQAEPRRPHPDRREPADPLDEPGQAVPVAFGHRLQGHAGSAPASPTTRGSSARTPSTPRSRAWRSGNSSRSRTTCARCGTSPRYSIPAPVWSCTRRWPTVRSGSARTHAAPIPTARSATTSTPTRRSSSRAPSRWSGAGLATTRFRDEMYAVRQAQPAVRRRQPRRRPRRLARGSRQRGARGDGRGEARQHRLLHPRTLRPGRHGAVQGRRAHVRVGEQPLAQPAPAVRLDLVVPVRAAVRRLAGRPGRPAGLPEALDRTDADGGGADRPRRQRPGHPRARALRPREHGARRARGPLLQRRAPVQCGPLPHRLRRRSRRARART